MIKKRSALLLIALTVICLTSVFVLAACDDQSANPNWVAQTETYKVNRVSIMGSTFMAEMALDTNNTKIILHDNGAFQLDIAVNKDIVEILMDAIGKLPGISEGGTIKDLLETSMSAYLDGMFPGVDFNDLDKTLGILKNSMGIEFMGLEKEKLYEVLNSLLNENSVPEGFEVPEGFGLRFRGKYELRDVANPVSGKIMKVVYVGFREVLDDAYFLFSIDGEGNMYGNCKFINTTVEAKRV